MTRHLVAALILVPTIANAAAFYPPMPFPAANQPSYVVLDDGTRLEGEVTAVVGGNGDVRKLTIREADGTRTKLTAAQVVEMGNKPGDLMRLAARTEASDSVAAHNVYDGRATPEWIVYDRVELPKNGKARLVQRLNPEFDSRIVVYPDPNAQETGGVAVGDLALTGGVEKSYLVRKDGDVQVVRKADYDAAFDALFGDCAALERPAKLDWKDFGDHVAAYDAACGVR